MMLFIKSITNHKYTRLAGVASAVVILASAIVYLQLKPDTNKSIDSDYLTYIHAHTGGVVQRNSSIKVQFASPLRDSVKLTDGKLFEFEPKITGKWSWIDESTVEFVPSDLMKSNQQYDVKLDLSLLYQVPPHLCYFNFAFSTAALDAEMYDLNLISLNPDDISKYKLEATLITSDVESSMLIEKCVNAKYRGKAVTLKWEHKPDSITHLLIIDTIIRTKERNEISLQFDGSYIDINNVFERKLSVPSLSEFEIIDVKVVESEAQYIRIFFSDPLLNSQQMDGLVYLNEPGNDGFKFDINKNELRCYPNNRLSGIFQLHIVDAVKNVLGYKLPKRFSQAITFSDEKPSVEILGSGVIMPNSDRLILPFESVCLRAVDVTVVRIFERNVEQFLQVNTLKDEYQLKRVGRPVAYKTIRLDKNKMSDLRRTTRFALDISEIIKEEPGAIYNVKLSFRPSYSLYRCDGDTSFMNEGTQEEESMESLLKNYEIENNIYDYDNEYYDYDYDYDWRQRDNPCNKSYYNSSRWVSRNVLATDIGLIIKSGENGEMNCYANDLATGKAIQGVNVRILDYQNQPVGTGVTDSKGEVKIATGRKPYLVVAEKGKSKTYLRIDDASSLMLSRFDIQGVNIQKGLKGFIYAERGIWRPGDSVFLNFMLDDRLQQVPSNQPVIMELYNPFGQMSRRIVTTTHTNRLYSFGTRTESDAPTGTWIVKVKVGSINFTKNIRVETVQPNRLKINMALNKPYYKRNQQIASVLKSNWLHGAPAQNLKATVEASYASFKTTFPKYAEYVFDDPTKQYISESETVFAGMLNESGEASISHTFISGDDAPGMLNLNLLTKVYEPGGNYSFDRFSVPYYPHQRYVGVKNILSKRDGVLQTDTTHKLDFVLLSPEGKLITEQTELEVKIYRLDWRFWWDQSNQNLTNYAEDTYYSTIQKARVKCVNGTASWNFRINYPDWGRYLIKVKDATSGHSTGIIVYLDWPSYYGTTPKGVVNEAAYLTCATSKAEYNIGETVSVSFPSSANARALISIENGTKVVQSFWVNTDNGSTTATFAATKDMLPNAYAHVTFIQPHAQEQNSLPMRMYGIAPFTVSDPSTHLNPVIAVANVVRSEEAFEVKVSETKGKKMTYTLAIVDEGLLDLTRFVTPNPHSAFYAHEALGVKTWDMYDFVLGASGIAMDRIIPVGGDEGLNRKGNNNQANRFKPVVKFIGPFVYNGKQNSHTITLPQYIGAVRVMVVASNVSDGSYGCSEKSVTVRNPLMVLATLPRALGLNEETNLSVSLFALEKDVKGAELSIQCNDLIEHVGPDKKLVDVYKKADGLATFKLKTRTKSGIGKIKVTLKGAGYTATQEIELNIRNANPYIYEHVNAEISPNQDWKQQLKLPGNPGTNTVLVEVSTLPNLNINKRLDYLIQYPYGCAEQVTSSAFPQLVIGTIADFQELRQNQIQLNINAAISRLLGYENTDGGFAYWPGLNYNDDWTTSYIGHFLLTSQKYGYKVPQSVINGWKQYQRAAAGRWSPEGGFKKVYSEMVQAYRLYTLALSKSPDFGAMNRLKEQQDMQSLAKWLLAGAYAISGQKKVAQEIIAVLPLSVDQSKDNYLSYGSQLRDDAIVLSVLNALGETPKAEMVLKSIAFRLSSNEWHNTQAISWALISVSDYLQNDKKESGLAFTYIDQKGNTIKVSTKSKVKIIEIPLGNATNLNAGIQASSSKLYAKFVMRGKPLSVSNTSNNSKIQMEVQYTDISGNPIDITTLKQGTQFYSKVSIRHMGITRENYENMALSNIFPSGWEIQNVRVEGQLNVSKSSPFTFQDIRDDRVNTFFNLNYNQSVVYYVLLNASYLGNYVMPVINCEAMYDNSVYANVSGGMVKILPSK